jgi:uncharacterized protein YbjQ (UPF0145 family)
MKIKKFYDEYGVNQQIFAEWVNSSGYRIKTSDWSSDVTFPDDQNVDSLIVEFRKFEQQRQAEYEKSNQMAAEAQAKADAEAKKKQEALASMLITSGFSFDGFTITKYSGYISGDDVVQVDRGRQGIFATATNVGASLMENLTVIRRNAINELKEAAYAMGCNAVIGIDFDYLTLDPETVNSQGGTLYMPYVFGVTANGNAVVIEKNKRTVS